MIMSDTPYFLWDYEIDVAQVRQILRGGSETEKAWMIARILTRAKYEDIWKFVKIKDVVTHFPRLRMHQQDKANWQRALKVWGYAV